MVYPAADWRDARAYAALAASQRARFAWEWLRRDPQYRVAFATKEERQAERFQLCRLECPDKSLDARPLWQADAWPAVLRACARPSLGTDAFDVAAFGAAATLYRSAQGEHLLLSDGHHDLRVDIVAGSLTQGPVDLVWELTGPARLAGALQRLNALAAFCRTGALPRRPERRAPRWIAALRVHDALGVGASQREIARLLLGEHAAPARWRVNAPEMRARVQRLVATARRMEQGGWRAFLSP